MWPDTFVKTQSTQVEDSGCIYEFEVDRHSQLFC